jgi:hypothetical protein
LSTYTLILIRRLYLHFTYLNGFISIELLDHPDTLAIHFDDPHMTESPAIRRMSHMTALVPSTKRRHEQLRVDPATQLLEPARVRVGYRNETAGHALPSRLLKNTLVNPGG